MTPIFTVVYLTLRYQNFDDRGQAQSAGNCQFRGGVEVWSDEGSGGVRASRESSLQGSR